MLTTRASRALRRQKHSLAKECDASSEELQVRSSLIPRDYLSFKLGFPGRSCLTLRRLHIFKELAMASQAADISNSMQLFYQLDDYPWAEDQEFQGGLRAILGSVQDPQQVEHLTLRAKCYYYARKAGSAVDFDGYKNWVESRKAGGAANGTSTNIGGDTLIPQIEQADGGMGDAPKPASFAEICDMIAEGKPIPGIKDIPDTILEGQASDQQAQGRKKPWEKSESEVADRPSWMT